MVYMDVLSGPLARRLRFASGASVMAAIKVIEVRELTTLVVKYRKLKKFYPTGVYRDEMTAAKKEGAAAAIPPRFFPPNEPTDGRHN